jgi:hypothetical protein
VVELIVIIRSGEKFLTLAGEEATTMRIRHSNRGEPYREGIDIEVDDPNGGSVRCFLDDREARSIRDLLNRLYPPA